MKHRQPTAPAKRRKRRAHDEAMTQVTGWEETGGSLERSMNALRSPQTSSEIHGAAALGLQHVVGNAQVARELSSNVRRSAEQVQRKGAGKKKPRAPGTTIINAPRQDTYEIEASTLADAATAINGRDEAGQTHWNPRWSYQADENGIITSATVNVDVTVTVPHWPGSEKLKKGARAEWGRFRQALAEHEQGHVDLVSEHLGGLAEKMIGKTPDEAQTLFDEALQALQKASDAYDKRTDHGRNSGTEINTDAE